VIRQTLFTLLALKHLPEISPLDWFAQQHRPLRTEEYPKRLEMNDMIRAKNVRFLLKKANDAQNADASWRPRRGLGVIRVLFALKRSGVDK